MTESIGSVSVEVVPDARGFLKRFQEQTEGQATEVGRSLGRAVREGLQSELDQNAADIRVNADVREAQARLEELRADIARTSGDVRVRVNTNAGAAAAQLAAVGAAERKVGDSPNDGLPPVRERAT